MVWEELDKFIKEYAAQVDPSNHEASMNGVMMLGFNGGNLPFDSTMASSSDSFPSPLVLKQEDSNNKQPQLQQRQSNQQYFSSEQSPGTKKRQNFSREITQILTDWLTAHYEHPYPSEQEKEALGRQVGLKVWLSEEEKKKIKDTQIFDMSN